MDKIKILDVGSTDQGAYRLLRTRVKKIDSDERFVNYIVCPPGKWQMKMVEEGVKWIKFDVTRSIGIINVFKEINALKNIFIEHNPDIVHSHNSKTGALARIAVYLANKKLDKKIKMIHQVHGYHFTTYSGVKKEVFLFIEKLLSNITDVLLFQNKYEYELSKDNNMDRKSKLIYIGNGINIEEFQNIKTTKSESEGNNIVCVARIEPVKNHIMLLRVIDVLKRKYNFDNFKLTLVGEGENAELSNFITENGLGNNVIFTGILDRNDVINIVYNSDISVLTSIKEGKPRALIESMLLGKPCVGTDVVGTNEVIQDGENGYLVNLNNFEEFADKIYLLMTNKEIYSEFSKKAKEFAYNNFNEDVVINKIISSYLN